MIHLTHLSTGQLRNILSIREQIETLESEIDSITAGVGEVPTPATEEAPKKGRRRRSAAVRAKMAAAAKARWAKIKGTGEAITEEKPAKKGTSRLIAAGRAIIAAEKATPTTTEKKDRRSSPATRAKLAAAARARWARVRAEGNKGL
jgi:hypothetical protein